MGSSASVDTGGDAKGDVKSWRLDTIKGMKKEDLNKHSMTAEGKEELQQLKDRMDKCVEWCDKHPEDQPTSVVAEATADDGGAEASIAKQEEFQTALEGMAAHAVKLRKQGAKSERTIQFTNNTVPRPLLECIEDLPNIIPTLGYAVPHVANIAST
eukprot:Hpha_TRINITY_DN16985_c0_g4::TRINITY_DN16985_c0_g4_i1::g.51654::m.51654